jgi:methylenetetrahydrofolate dehydrogenase (NADP+) / methenyltetrahydrofolate cyclohydrolase
MAAIIFDGLTEALKREQILKTTISELTFAPRLLSVVFSEDEGSELYTRLKFDTAARCGIEFDRTDHRLSDPLSKIHHSINEANRRPDIHGVMIQKPAKKVWQEYFNGHQPEINTFEDWWRLLANRLEPQKDVDCLSQTNLDLVYTGNWVLLPATVKAILAITGLALNQLNFNPVAESALTTRAGQSSLPLNNLSAVVVGRSDIVGRPLAAVLEQFGATVLLAGSKTYDLAEKLETADLIVTATGQENLLTGEILKPGAIVIDAGSPKAEVDWATVIPVAGFVTPVPYGVGPLTVISLLENLTTLSTGA